MFCQIQRELCKKRMMDLAANEAQEKANVMGSAVMVPVSILKLVCCITYIRISPVYLKLLINACTCLRVAFL